MFCSASSTPVSKNQSVSLHCSNNSKVKAYSRGQYCIVCKQRTEEATRRSVVNITMLFLKGCRKNVTSVERQTILLIFTFQYHFIETFKMCACRVPRDEAEAHRWLQFFGVQLKSSYKNMNL